MTSQFDGFAWFYDRYWAAPFQDWQQPAMEQLLFPCVEPGARILDLCCGTGALSERLGNRGYQVMGVDSSAGMLNIAREKVQSATFLLNDAAEFQLEAPVDAVVCVFDSVNNVLDEERLQQVFHRAYFALRTGGTFVFDVNTGGAYGERWDHSFCQVEDDHAFFLRGGFDRQSRIGVTRVTMFRFMEEWLRSDVELRQRPWEYDEITPMLKVSGFDEVRGYRACEDLRMAGHYGIGRLYFRARKPANS